jgi:hypothetical protein
LPAAAADAGVLGATVAAEALAAYQHARTMLVQELGADPGTELRRLHQQVLAGDPRLSVRGQLASAAGRRRPAAPRQLPGNARYFTGRSAELTLLNTWLEGAARILRVHR